MLFGPRLISKYKYKYNFSIWYNIYQFSIQIIQIYMYFYSTLVNT